MSVIFYRALVILNLKDKCVQWGKLKKLYGQKEWTPKFNADNLFRALETTQIGNNKIQKHRLFFFFIFFFIFLKFWMFI